MMNSRTFRAHMDLRRRLAFEMTTTAAAVASPEAVEELRRLSLCDKPETARKSCMALVRLGRAGRKAEDRKAGKTGNRATVRPGTEDRGAGDRETVTVDVVLSPIEPNQPSWSAVEGAGVEVSTGLSLACGQHPQGNPDEPGFPWGWHQEPVPAGSRPFRLVPPGAGAGPADCSNTSSAQYLQRSACHEVQGNKNDENGVEGYKRENRKEENSKDRNRRSQTTTVLYVGTGGTATNPGAPG